MREFFIVYILLNVLVFVVYGIDKYRAIQKKYRIPEATLLWLAVSGVVGAIAGMLVFRHKIRKAKFGFVIGMIALAESVLMLLYFL